MLESKNTVLLCHDVIEVFCNHYDGTPIHLICFKSFYRFNGLSEVSFQLNYPLLRGNFFLPTPLRFLQQCQFFTELSKQHFYFAVYQTTEIRWIHMKSLQKHLCLFHKLFSKSTPTWPVSECHVLFFGIYRFVNCYCSAEFPAVICCDTEFL
jgi:hypothetical protein